jgi:uncharacterized protein YbdZ (MbtH family)
MKNKYIVWFKPKYVEGMPEGWWLDCAITNKEYATDYVNKFKSKHQEFIIKIEEVVE